MLKELLGDKWTEEIESLLKDKVEAVGSGEGKIPKERFDKVNNEKKELIKQVNDFKIQVEDLSKDGTTLEDLKEQLNIKTKEFTEYQESIETEKANSKKTDAIIKRLSELNALNPKLLVKEFSLSDISFDDDGKLVGVKDTFERLQSEYKQQFGIEQITTPKPKDDGGGGSITKEAFKAYSYKERVALKESNPKEYEKLNQ